MSNDGLLNLDVCMNTVCPVGIVFWGTGEVTVLSSYFALEFSVVGRQSNL